MKASQYLKNAVSFVTAIAKAKSKAVKTKSSVIKNRLLIFALFRDKMVRMSAASRLNHIVLTSKKNGRGGRFGQTKSGMQNNSIGNEVSTNRTSCTNPVLHRDSDDDYSDSRHSLFHSEDEQSKYELVGIESVIDLIGSSQEDQNSELRLEDDVDLFADIFIRRFYWQMWMQKKKHDQDMVFQDTKGY